MAPLTVFCQTVGPTVWDRPGERPHAVFLAFEAVHDPCELCKQNVDG